MPKRVCDEIFLANTKLRLRRPRTAINDSSIESMNRFMNEAGINALS